MGGEREGEEEGEEEILTAEERESGDREEYTRLVIDEKLKEYKEVKNTKIK